MTRVGVDVGGTFTDLVVVDDEGRLHTSKTGSTPDRPDDAVLSALTAARERDPAVADPDFLGHGTTVTTNAVLERALPETALVTTEGFRDVLEIGRQDRPDLYDLDVERPAPLVSRDRRYEVTERVGPGGRVLTELDEADVRDVAGRIPDSVAAVAVSTLFSFAEDAHERAIADVLDEHLDARVVRSSAVLPEFREYERTATTALNAALSPVIDEYLGRLADRTRATGIGREWAVMASNGGLMSTDSARESPVSTLLSGPAAGVTGAGALARAAGYEDVVTMDMGGTSTDVSLVDGGDPLFTTDWTIGDRPLRVPAVDVHTIGAGGGSIARVDAGGALRVGPQSAGADPGPAAYGEGGTSPTVTDAHVVLGRIHPDHPLGGELSVDVEAARTAVERGVADPLGMTVEESARGIVRVARANMERALRVVSVERGYDPRSLALVAFGGAGPLHGPGLARSLSIPTVLVPRVAGVLSGLGLLAADHKHTYVSSVVDSLDDVDPDRVDEALAGLVAEGAATLREEGIDDGDARFERALDLRYVGQSYSLTVDLPADGDDAVTRETLSAATAAFHRAHDEQYGHADPDEPVELVAVRVTAVGETPGVDPAHDPGTTVEDAHLGTRAVGFADGAVETDVYDHERLPPGADLAGPAVVQARSATTAIHPDQSATVDDRGTLVVDAGVDG